MTDEEWAKSILSEYDWQGAVVPEGQWQRNSDMPKFLCMRCNSPASWERPRITCHTCKPLRVLLRKTIQTAREKL